jgi:hypothetical protein
VSIRLGLILYWDWDLGWDKQHVPDERHTQTRGVGGGWEVMRDGTAEEGSAVFVFPEIEVGKAKGEVKFV